MKNVKYVPFEERPLTFFGLEDVETVERSWLNRDTDTVPMRKHVERGAHILAPLR